MVFSSKVALRRSYGAHPLDGSAPRSVATPAPGAAGGWAGQLMEEERDRLGNAREGAIIGLARTPAMMRLLGERAWWTPGRG